MSTDTICVKGVDVPRGLIERSFGLFNTPKNTRRQIREIHPDLVDGFKAAVKQCGFGKVYESIVPDRDCLSQWECENILADMGFRVTESLATAFPRGSSVMFEIQVAIRYR